MNKKNYTTPALSVEEFKMNEVICTSDTPVNQVQFKFGEGDSFIVSPTGGDGKGGSAPRARSRRGIWDED